MPHCELLSQHIPHLIKAQTLCPVTPHGRPEPVVQLFARMSKGRQILAKHNDCLRTYFLCFGDQLQFSQASLTSLIVAGNNNLFLLDGKRQGFQCWVNVLDDRGIETIIVDVDQHPTVISHQPFPHRRARASSLVGHVVEMVCWTRVLEIELPPARPLVPRSGWYSRGRSKHVQVTVERSANKLHQLRQKSLRSLRGKSILAGVMTRKQIVCGNLELAKLPRRAKSEAIDANQPHAST
jgi:hypothetical protein